MDKLASLVLIGIVILVIGVLFVVLGETISFKKKKGGAKRALLWVGIAALSVGGICVLAVVGFHFLKKGNTKDTDQQTLGKEMVNMGVNPNRTTGSSKVSVSYDLDLDSLPPNSSSSDRFSSSSDRFSSSSDRFSSSSNEASRESGKKGKRLIYSDYGV